MNCLYMHVLYIYNDKDNVNEKKKKTKIALSQFFSPGSLPALRNLLKMAKNNLS